MRRHNYCYFHARWHRKGRQVTAPPEQKHELRLPNLDDAKSIQLALADVMREVMEDKLDHETAILVIYALQIASANLTPPEIQQT